MVNFRNVISNEKFIVKLYFVPIEKCEKLNSKVCPFSLGLRNCVGKRMALLQIRVALVRLIYNYKLLPCSKTIDEMVPDIQSSGLLPKGGMWVKIEKRM